MKTEVIMKRELFGKEISQKSKSEFFSATDLIRAGNTWRSNNNLPPINLHKWLNSESVKAFVTEIENSTGAKAYVSATGRGQHSWMHPYLFIDLALHISPKLKVEVYSWLYDELLKFRNQSGDSYKKMAGSVYVALSNKSLFKETIVDIASKIREACGIKDDAEWQTASEDQLKLRDKIHENISLFSDIVRDIDSVVRIAIKKATS